MEDDVSCRLHGTAERDEGMSCFEALLMMGDVESQVLVGGALLCPVRHKGHTRGQSEAQQTPFGATRA